MKGEGNVIEQCKIPYIIVAQASVHLIWWFDRLRTLYAEIFYLILWREDIRFENERYSILAPLNWFTQTRPLREETSGTSYKNLLTFPCVPTRNSHWLATFFDIAKCIVDVWAGENRAYLRIWATTHCMCKLFLYCIERIWFDWERKMHSTYWHLQGRFM